MAESWDGVARAYDRVSRQSRAHRDKIERVAVLVARSGATRILDLGCGSGVLETRLFNLGYSGTVTAIDQSREMLGLARASCEGYPVAVELRDLDSTLPYGAGSFDCAVAMNVLFLLEDPAATMAEVHRVLEPGAPFIVVMPKPDTKGPWAFLWEHFREMGAVDALREAHNLLKNMPAVVAAARFQAKLDREHAATGERYLTRVETERLLRKSRFEVVAVADIQAGQNWVFECVAR